MIYDLQSLRSCIFEAHSTLRTGHHPSSVKPAKDKTIPYVIGWLVHGTYLSLAIAISKTPTAFHLWKCHTSIFKVWPQGCGRKNQCKKMPESKYIKPMRCQMLVRFLCLCIWIFLVAWMVEACWSTVPSEALKPSHANLRVSYVLVMKYLCRYAWKMVPALASYLGSKPQFWSLGITMYHWNHCALIHTDRGPKLLHVLSADMSSSGRKWQTVLPLLFSHP